MIFLFWFNFAVVVALMGDSRKIGVWAAFFISIFLSPLIGFIVVLASDKKHPQRVIIQSVPEVPTSKADELTKMKGLLDAGTISKDEFEVQKSKILNS